MARAAKPPAGGSGRAAPARAPRQREPSLAEEIAESGETPMDDLRAAERADREDHAFLAREFLTWLAYHAESAGGQFKGGGDAGVEPFTIVFGGKLTLRTLAGQVTDVVLKGASPALSADLRYALAGGLSVKEAELRLDQGDRSYTLALAAEHFDLKRVKLPAALSEEEGEVAEETRVDDRLDLLAGLEASLRHAFGHFLALRARPAWSRDVVPAIRAWLEAGT